MTPMARRATRFFASKLLRLNRTQVTRTGVAQLRKSLPNLEIITPW
jgi:hypothetical protein